MAEATLTFIAAGALVLCKTSSKNGSGKSPAPLPSSISPVRVSTEAALSLAPFVGFSEGYFVLLAALYFILRPSMTQFSTEASSTRWAAGDGWCRRFGPKF